MNYLYVDNFRGFSQTIIPFEDVNFFVGENSTGKTSILALINLISSPQLWFNQDFNTPYYEFGGYKDIVSSNAKNARDFTFGVCWQERDNKKRSQSHEIILASFQERESLPYCSFLARANESKIVAMKDVNNYFKFYTKDHYYNKSCKRPIQMFQSLGNIKHLDKSEFKEFPKEYITKLPTQTPLLPALSMLEGLLAGKLGKIRRNIYRMPASPFISEIMAMFAPIRTRPKRTYDGYGRDYSPEGEHTPYVLRKRLGTEEKAKLFRSKLEQFGKSSGLFNKVIINELGNDATAPFEVLIALSDKALRINSVGYGVSQVLPLVVEMIIRPKNSWVVIQQPEVHLHPKAQAALGDLIFLMAEDDKKHFIIETHTDFTIDRFRMNYRANKSHKTKAQILFFERKNGGNTASVIPIQQDGKYPKKQPKSFRDFFMKEQINLLGI